MSADTRNLTLRIPANLHARVKKEADSRGISMNQLATAALYSCLQQDDYEIGFAYSAIVQVRPEEITRIDEWVAHDTNLFLKAAGIDREDIISIWVTDLLNFEDPNASVWLQVIYKKRKGDGELSESQGMVNGS